MTITNPRNAFALLLIVAGCTQNSDPNLAASKQNYADRQPLSADAFDPCEVHDWYGDGVCDTFCGQPDPDCGETLTECTSDAHCGEGQSCIPGELCFTWCEVGDPSCCTGNTCQTQEPAADNECTRDDQCAQDEKCVPGDYCLYWCEAGDPSCCTGNTCQPLQTNSENECTSDTDCPNGQACIAGDLCLYWCEAGDPSCCTGNRCQ